MLSFLRRLINSRAGIVITLGVLGVVALAFAAGDVSGLRTRGMGAIAGDTVATVGGHSISGAELKERVANEVDNLRQQQPTLTVAQYVAGGGVEGTLQRLVNGLAMTRFGGDQGMVVSKRAVDGQLASIPGLQGPNGQFDQTIYQRLLASRKLTDAQIRGDIAQQTLASQLTLPTIGATQVPQGLALPYASLLLERRQGQVGFVPTKALIGGPAPTDAELDAFYRRNVARYTVPQRRVARYALVSAETVKARATPTDAEIAAAYGRDQAKYAAAEKRTVESVVAADAATANAIAARVGGGTSLVDAARAAGLEASTQTQQTEAAFAATLSPAIAKAVFAAGKGAVVGPLKAPLGFVVARSTVVEQSPARSLAQVRGEIAAELGKAKSLQALAALHDSMDDALVHNATFDEVIGDQKLTAQTTPPLLADGADPDHPDAKPDPALVPIATAAFGSEEGDPPQLVSIGRDGDFALVGLARIVPAAPRPLLAIRAAVLQDFGLDRARAAARKLAGQIVAKANAGTPLAQAVAGAGVAGLPPVKPVNATRGELAAAPGGQPPAALVLLFSMNQGATRLLEAPGNAGYFLIHVDRIEPGNAAGNTQVIAATRDGIGRVTGREYVEQFAGAVRAQLGVKIDNAAVARVKAELAGGNGGAAR